MLTDDTIDALTGRVRLDGRYIPSRIDQQGWRSGRDGQQGW
jgi:hypothetical protein